MPHRRWAHPRTDRAILEGMLPGYMITAKDLGDHAAVRLLTIHTATEWLLEDTAPTLDEAMDTGEAWALQLGLLTVDNPPLTDRDRRRCTQH